MPQEKDPNYVDINSLSLQQLVQLNKEYQQKEQYLASAAEKIKEIRARFISSKSALKEFKPENEDANALIPLTDTLYVPGKVVKADRLLINIGTSYYVEMGSKQAAEYLSNRISFLSKQIEEAVTNYRLIHEFNTNSIKLIQQKSSAMSKS